MKFCTLNKICTSHEYAKCECVLLFRRKAIEPIIFAIFVIVGHSRASIVNNYVKQPETAFHVPILTFRLNTADAALVLVQYFSPNTSRKQASRTKALVCPLGFLLTALVR